jgi:hypothetical protein
MPHKLILKSGTYKKRKRKRELFFLDWLKKFDKSPNDWDNIAVDLNEIPLQQEPIIPEFLSHCSYLGNIRQMIEDRRMGGRRVLSGNLEFTPSEIHFSPIPFLIGNYNNCIVFNTKRLLKRNPLCSLTPTYYKYLVPNKEERESIALYFDEGGWKKLNLKEKGIYKADQMNYSEREWSMDAPIHFRMEDMEAIFTNILWRKDRPVEMVNYLTIPLFDDNPNNFLAEYNRLKNHFYSYQRMREDLFYFDNITPLITNNDDIVAIIIGKGSSIEINYGFTQESLEKSIYKGILDKDYSKVKDMFDSEGLVITKNHFEKW